jgi:hypothetical protein
MTMCNVYHGFGSSPPLKLDPAYDLNTKRCSKGRPGRDDGVYFSWLEATPTINSFLEQLILF